MRKRRFSEEQIFNILKGVEAGQRVADACRAHGISEQIFYRWKANFGRWAFPSYASSNCSGTWRGKGLTFSGLKDKRLAVEGAFERREQGMSVLAGCREVATHAVVLQEMT